MKNYLFTVLASFLLLLFMPATGQSQAPNLGVSSGFALFTAGGAFNVDLASVTVVGDVGTDVGAFNGFPPGNLNGTVYGETTTEAANAATAVASAYSQLSGVACGTGGTLTGTLGGGQILTPNVYCHGAATSLNGALILDAQGNPGAIFIIKINGALSTAGGSSIVLRNGADLCNVYWQINGAVHLGGSFLGTIVAAGEIELLTGASLTGRGLTTAGAINLRGNNSASLGTATPAVITAGSAIALCAGGSVVLSGNNRGGAWNTGATTSSITVSAAGDYFVTTTNGCGTTESNHIVVTVDAAPVAATITASGPISFCAGGNVTLSSTISGVWSTGETGTSINVTAAGDYYVTTTTDCGSSESNHIIVTITPLPMVSVIAAQGPIIFCTGGSVTLSGNSGGTWNTGATTPTINVTAAGSYFVTTTNACGTVTSIPIVVTVNMPLTASIITASGATTFCTGQSVVLSGNTNGGTWSNGSTSTSITVSESGDYFVVNTNTCGSVTSNHIMVSVSPLATSSIITANDAVTFCVGDSVTLSGNVNGTWSTGATTASIVVKTSGDYFVTNTDSCGTVSSNHIIVQVDLPPSLSVITASDTTSFCEPGSVTLSGNVGGAWNTGETTPSIVVTTSGEYFVTASNSCATLVSNKIIVNVHPLPIASIITSNRTDDTICVGDSVILSGNAGGTWNTGSTASTIVVKNTGTFFVSSSNFCGTVTSNIINIQVDSMSNSVITANGPTTFCTGDSVILTGNIGGTWNTGATTTSITVKTSGDYFVTQLNACDSGISNHIQVLVKIITNPDLRVINNLTICEGDSITITGNNGGVWNTGDSASTIVVNTTGFYFVVNDTVCDSIGLNTVTNLTVLEIPDAPSVLQDTICLNNEIILGNPSTAGHTYKWTTNYGLFISNLANPKVRPLGTTTYILQENNGICQATNSVKITVGPLPSCLIKGNNIICEGGSTELCAPAGAYTYRWNTGETTRCITVDSVGYYIVEVTNSFGCSSRCGRNVIRGEGPCDIVGNALIYAGQSTQFCAPAGYASYAWSSGETTRCITAKTAGTYSLTVTNALGCVSICSKILTVEAEVYCEIIGDTLICPDTYATLCAVSRPGNTYYWNNGQTTQCIEINCQGTYSVQVTNSNASSICVIVVKNAPLLPRSLSHCIISGNLNPAQGQTTTLCAPAGYLNYLWSNGAVTSCITVNIGGTYAVRASNGGGCSHTCQVKVVYPSSNLNSLENRSTELPPVDNLKINAYPNPFNTVAHFEFQTGQADSKIKVEVTGLTGNKIFTLFDGKAEKGQVYRVSMDGHFMAEGVYLYRIINGDQSITKKLVLIR